MGYEVTNKSTVYGYNTPHGYRTPHKYPTDAEVSLSSTFTGMTKQLYPTGRAFYLPENGTYEKVHQAVNKSLIGTAQSAKSIVQKSIPDNPDFNESDVSFYEEKLGLFLNPETDLETRKLSILRKMAFPANVVPRQNPKFLESQLRLAGFDVRVYENRFLEGGEYVQKTPDELATVNPNNTLHGNGTLHGTNTLHGSAGFTVIANSNEPGETFNIGTGLWATFFISGELVNQEATVQASREKELRELVLKLKPAHTVAFIFINFI